MRRVLAIRSSVAAASRLRHCDVIAGVNHSRCVSGDSVTGGAASPPQDPTRNTPPPPAGTSPVAAANDGGEGFGFTRPQYDNSRLIYASKSTGELVRSYLVFGACSLDLLVDNHAKVSSPTYTLAFVYFSPPPRSPCGLRGCKN